MTIKILIKPNTMFLLSSNLNISIVLRWHAYPSQISIIRGGPQKFSPALIILLYNKRVHCSHIHTHTNGCVTKSKCIEYNLINYLLTDQTKIV